jgi:hypothetical protein
MPEVRPKVIDGNRSINPQLDIPKQVCFEVDEELSEAGRTLNRAKLKLLDPQVRSAFQLQPKSLLGLSAGGSTCALQAPS